MAYRRTIDGGPYALLRNNAATAGEGRPSGEDVMEESRGGGAIARKQGPLYRVAAQRLTSGWPYLSLGGADIRWSSAQADDMIDRERGWQTAVSVTRLKWRLSSLHTYTTRGPLTSRMGIIRLTEEEPHLAGKASSK